MTHTSKCVPPSAGLSTILLPIKRDAQAFGTLSSTAPVVLGLAVPEQSALIVTASAPVRVRVLYQSELAGGFDGSGLVVWIQRAERIYIPRPGARVDITSLTASEQATVGYSVWVEEIQTVEPPGPKEP